jgi:glutamine synthetase
MELPELHQLVDDQEIDTIITVFPDMLGRLVGKRITGHFFVDTVASSGMHACDYLLACDVEMDPVPGFAFTSWSSGYGDMHAVPDLGTLRCVPWHDKSALVICDLYAADNQPVRIAPRQILRDQLARADLLGLLPKGGSELEFYVFRDTFEGARHKQYHDLEPYGWYIEDYHILQGSKEEWLIREMRNGMDAAGVPVEFSKGEWGPGQHEINLRFADFLEMADRHVIYKHGVKEIAALHDVSVTFMAKWHEKYAGSSCHLHASLWSPGSETSLCAEGGGAYGMSKIFRQWLAGQLAYARELTLLYAPFVNSYKRYQPGSFAPTRIGWAVDNRTVGFRVLGHQSSLRVENRIPGADINPYLAFAAMLVAGLAGIEEELELGEPYSGDAYAASDLVGVPQSLEEATHLFDSSALARRALGDDVVDHYVHAARTELSKFASTVTCWERQRHFERT